MSIYFASLKHLDLSICHYMTNCLSPNLILANKLVHACCILWFSVSFLWLRELVFGFRLRHFLAIFITFCKDITSMHIKRNLLKLSWLTSIVYFFEIGTALHIRRLYLKYSKTCVNRPLSERPQICFQDKLSFNAG